MNCKKRFATIKTSTRKRFHKKQRPCLSTGPLFSSLTTLKLHGQGVANAVEGVVDLLAEGAHNRNNDDGDERENDRVLYETLTFFFGSE